MTFILNDCIRLATSRPILPKPMMANVLPFNSSPMNADRCHWPDFNELHALGILLQWQRKRTNQCLSPNILADIHLANEQISAHVCSAAESVFPPGVLDYIS
jgi:hypothetical protein